jgi:hypothetical protein
MMPDTPVPWIGLAALIAMFVLPFLPDWLFQGSRTTKHWPHRHICGDCHAPWIAGHICTPETTANGHPPIWVEIRHSWLRQGNPRPLNPKAASIVRSKDRRDR